MIIDEAIATHKQHSPFLHPLVLQRVVAASHRAKRLKFDTDSSRLLGAFIHDCLDLIIKHRQFAMPLYDTMYIEIETDAMYNEIGGRAAGQTGLDDPYTDVVIGFLIDYRTVYTIAKGPLGTLIMPVFQYINPRGVYEEPGYGKDLAMYRLLKSPADEEQLDIIAHLMLMFGSSFNNIKTQMTNEELQLLTHEVNFYWGGSKSIEKISTKGHEKVLTEMVGDTRNIYGALLWLNSLPHTIKYTSMPAGHRIIHGKRVPMSAHNTVHIHMKGTVQVRNLFIRTMKAREHPRRHDVRGFWRHHGGIAQGCGHQWPEIPDKRHKFVCTKCQRERWWINAHQRGDTSKGFVSKEYKVEI